MTVVQVARYPEYNLDTKLQLVMADSRITSKKSKKKSIPHVEIQVNHHNIWAVSLCYLALLQHLQRPSFGNLFSTHKSIECLIVVLKMSPRFLQFPNFTPCLLQSIESHKNKWFTLPATTTVCVAASATTTSQRPALFPQLGQLLWH